jgi:predicted TIM-barrel fold metal-dependent hydrolase
MRFVLIAIVGAVPLYGQPAADHHQHFLRSSSAPPAGFALNAKELITQMDEVGIRRAAVFSIAYQFGNPNRPPVENEYERVKAENDWTREQTALYPRRLTVFCSVNPLKEYALAEIARCAKDSGLRAGLKLHFGNSDVDLQNPAHVTQLQSVFREANRHRMAIVAHVRSTVSRKRPWGAAQARVLLEAVIPAAPNVPIQIAHLTGAGGYDDPGSEGALGVFIDAIANRDKRMKRVLFDLSGVFLGQWESKADVIASRLRAIGLDRVLYGSDSPPLEAWKKFRKLPLTAKEFGKIEKNTAPYLNLK